VYLGDPETVELETLTEGLPEFIVELTAIIGVNPSAPSAPFGP